MKKPADSLALAPIPLLPIVQLATDRCLEVVRGLDLELRRLAMEILGDLDEQRQRAARLN